MLLYDQVILSDLKGVTCSYEDTENFYSTLQFPSALWGTSPSFSWLLWLYVPQVYCFGLLSPLS